MAPANALDVPTPEGFDTRESGSRVVFIQAGDLRSPMQISLWRAEAPPSFEAPERDGDLYFELQEREGGSAGPLHVLRGYKATEPGFIVLEAEAQQELGRPDFGSARAALRQAR